jgi:hypothetical protein
VKKSKVRAIVILLEDMFRRGVRSLSDGDWRGCHTSGGAGQIIGQSSKQFTVIHFPTNVILFKRMTVPGLLSTISRQVVYQA